MTIAVTDTAEGVRIVGQSRKYLRRGFLAQRGDNEIGVGRKNYLFAGSHAGGDHAAAIYSLLGTAKLNGHNLEAFVREVLTRLPDHPINRINELLPWNLQPALITTLAGDDVSRQLGK